MNAQERIDAVFCNPAASYWLKDALRAALKRDIVDALNDAEELCDVLEEILRETVKQ